jgi:cell division protein FtsQ
LFYAGAIAAILVSAGAGAWYFARNGTLAQTLAPIEARVADAAVALDLTVQRVEVEGRERVERQAILKAVGAGLGAPILSVDLDTAKVRLEAIPWVHSAAVERRLPDEIYIRLVERQPLAIWQHHHRFDLIDRDGTVIPTVRPDDFPSLPQVVGDGAPQAAADLIEMLANEPDLAAHVTALVSGAGISSSTMASRWRCPKRPRRPLGTTLPCLIAAIACWNATSLRSICVFPIAWCFACRRTPPSH